MACSESSESATLHLPALGEVVTVLAQTLTGQLPHRPQKRPRWTPQTRCHGQLETRRSPPPRRGPGPDGHPRWSRCTTKGADPRTEHGETSYKLLMGSTGVRAGLPVPFSSASWLGRSVVFVFGLVVSALRACSDFPLFLPSFSFPV